MKYLLFIFVSAISCWSVMEGALGWDGIQEVSADGFKCLASNGYSFYIGRVWRSLGKADLQGMKNIKNARAAGWKNVDGYMFPCHKEGCASAKEQIKSTLQELSANAVEIGMLWLDVEIFDWPADKAANQKFILDMIKHAEKAGVKVGIYTSPNNWESIVGIDWNGAAEKPLWYAHWDKKQSFDGFKAFGGWTKPAMHQFEGDVKGPCNVNMDKNWKP